MSNTNPSEDRFLLNPQFDMVKGQKHHRVGTRTHLYAALIAIVICAIAVAWAISDIRRNIDWNAQAQIIQAEIIDRQVEDRADSDRDRWYIVYRFTLPPRTVYQNRISVDRALYERLTVGSPVYVKYLPGGPAISTLATSELAPLDVDFLALLLTLAPALTLATLFWAVRVTVRNYRLEYRGEVLKGQVVSCTAETIGGSYYVTINYMFQTPDKRELKGKLVRVREDLRTAKLPEKGAHVSVLYVNDRFFRLL